MKHLLNCAAFAAAMIVAVALSRGEAFAAPSCSMTTTSLADLIANYDPPVSTTTTAVTISAGVLSFTCSGLGGGSASHVYVELNGASGTSLVTPFLSGPNAFKLNYTPCIPGSGTCNGSASLWQNTTGTAYKDTGAVNGSNSIPSFSIFLGRQDAYVGTVTDYTGSLFFSFVCGEGGGQVPC